MDTDTTGACPDCGATHPLVTACHNSPIPSLTAEQAVKWEARCNEATAPVREEQTVETLKRVMEMLNNRLKPLLSERDGNAWVAEQENPIELVKLAYEFQCAAHLLGEVYPSVFLSHAKLRMWQMEQN